MFVLVSSNRDNSIDFWDVSTGEHLRSIVPQKITNAIAFSPDGQTLASSHAREINLWDIGTGDITETFTGHADDIFPIVFSPDGKVLISGGDDDTIRAWDMETGELRFPPIPHSGHVTASTSFALAYSPDGSIFASGSSDAGVYLWDSQTGKAIHTFVGHVFSVSDVVFSPDGGTLASCSIDGTVLLWDLTTLDFNR